MIVSELEIHKVMDLLGRPALPSPFPERVGARSRTTATATATRPVAGICSDNGRSGRLDGLRFLLAHGAYDVAPSMVADKMMGRAICDQVARLYDA